MNQQFCRGVKYRLEAYGTPAHPGWVFFYSSFF